MSRLFFAIIAFSFSNISYAGFFGLGVQASDDGYVIYLPFEIKETWIVEPYFSKEKNDTKHADYEGLDKTEYSSYQIGLGTFFLKGIGNNIEIYYGGRLGYIESKVEWETNYEGGFSKDDRQEDGYKIGPTLGFRYSFNENFSLAAEAEYIYRSTESVQARDNNGYTYKDTNNYRSTTTQTNFIARYMF